MAIRDHKRLGEEAVRIAVLVSAIMGANRIVPPATAAMPAVDLTPIQSEIAALRRDVSAELRDHDRRLLAVERAQ